MKMSKLTGKCPRVDLRDKDGNDIICGYSGYNIIKQGVFSYESGYDPSAIKVSCRRCGCEYYIFPLVVPQ